MNIPWEITPHYLYFNRNVDELDSYAELVSLGKPDFIEIKVMRSYLPWYVHVNFNLQFKNCPSQ
jgi:wyosine [tRNA(Phe)-imidazoG37] synthetase (radical SAM superfamily)